MKLAPHAGMARLFRREVSTSAEAAMRSWHLLTPSRENSDLRCQLGRATTHPSDANAGTMFSFHTSTPSFAISAITTTRNTTLMKAVPREIAIRDPR